MTPLPAPFGSVIVYPDSDGKPIADNTRQFRWILFIHNNLAALFAGRADVFVAAAHLWYAVKGYPEKRVALDVMLAFGRPKGDRGSYKQWVEGNVPVTVAFEIVSPGNEDEMAKKFSFYDEYGVEEYYIYDPDTNKLEVFVRGLGTFRQIHDIASYRSRRMGIRFEMTHPEMTIYGPDGKRFITFEESLAETRAVRAQREEAERQDDDARRQADAAITRVARLAQLGRKARRGQASAEEVAELERLEDEVTSG